ncbi:MAG: hypothetical protein IT581_08410 [Verrucomicrobiales bacterium]|nr:hypothetical protein [Verrucomicrobiales bacterium]
MRLLNTLLLLFATLAQGVFASPSSWRGFIADDATAKSSHTQGVSRCRCCDCGGSACCALPANPRIPHSDQAAPFKVASAPEGPCATTDGVAPDSWLCPFSGLALAMAPTNPSVGLLPGRQPPAFLRGGGLLI